jgi:DNA-binding Lrp family transcriptional regulator
MPDDIDLRLLGALEKDATQTVKVLAAMVGLAISSTHDRLKSLRKRGLLKGAHAETDPKAFGVHIQALLFIEVANQGRELVDGFLDHLAVLPFVRTAFHVTGRYDLIVHVLAHDMQDLKAVELDHFTSHPAVARVETSIIFDWRYRFETPAY